MARPKANLPDPAAIRALADAQGRLALRVTPGARVEAISLAEGQVAVKVRAKPTDGAANAAVLALLAKALDIAPSRISLLRGESARDKLVRVDF
ncbi:MAG: DUF167 domain-containing protein [Proteobacteria bacterium]|nr:DUF167 domain-containing protein [Pseudomonadota bacterium]